VLKQQLIQIAERAATLEQRLERSVFPFQDDAAQERVRSRINNWKEAVAKGDDNLFLKRLQIEGIDRDNLQQLLAATRYPDAEALPPWIETLSELIASTEYVERKEEEKQQVFAEVLLPFVRVARQKLNQKLDTQVLAPPAFARLERTLLLRLSRVCSRPLALELNVDSLLGRLKGETPQERYDDFVRNRIATPGGMLQFFTEYSVAAQLTSSLVDQWIDSTAEFLARLQTDLPEITDHFCAGQNPGKVIAIKDHLSDSHNHGRTSKQLTFESGFKLIYKPKNLTIDSAFQDLLKWMNAQQNFLPQKTFSLLNKRTHGWVEFLTPAGCENRQEIENYFRRTGMLLCLLHTLGANDCHSENLFACGEYPVLVDLETLLEVRPAAAINRLQTADEAAQEVSRMSLLHTGMLPNWIYGDAAAVGGYDSSGLMGGSAQQFPFRTPEWIETKTDKMRLEFKFLDLPVSPSQPVLLNAPVSAAEHQESIQQGFIETYSFLIKQRDALRNTGILDRLASGEIRYLHRATAEYALILQKSLNPSLLREGIDRSIHLDLLWRNLFLRDTESMSPIVKCERQALERLDIPYFTVEPGETALISDRKTPVPFVKLMSSAERLHARLVSMNSEAMNRQITYLEAAISMRSPTRLQRTSPSETMDAPLLDQLGLIKAADRIGECLKRSAIHAKDSGVTWLGADYVPQSKQYTISPIRNSLYSGKTGIALFLAALDTFVPDKGYAELALATLHSVRQTFRGETAALHARSMELGAMSGIGSLCWSFLQIGQLLREPILLEEAAAIGSRVTQAQIAKDRHLDIILGSAGAILSFLALHRSSPASGFLEQAMECGEHLMAESIQTGTGIRAWKSFRDEMLTGFSHGASGYAYALLRLFEATGNERFRDGALEAFAYERSVFSPKHRNWPDLRLDQNAGSVQRFMTGWCHGAPGIALARIGSLALVPDQAIKEEIEIALDTTLRAGIPFQDDACCGNFSRIETLLIASRYFKRADFYDAALMRASAIMQRASQTGAFQLEPAVAGETVINPGFMKGLAGVGYGLLRLADEENRLPTPLLM
jgi:type 2 lantibiotic biosynthesis protein LanM